jgi:beta-glucosidase
MTDTVNEAVLPYRDASLPIDERVEDLLGRMELADKVGMLFHTMAAFADLEESNPTFGLPSLASMVRKRRMSHFNLLGAAPGGREFAAWHNALQRMALDTPLGIPITLSTDPRHSFSDNPLTSLMAGPFSQWPETLGFAALGSPERLERFADIARQEYIAVGLRVALHPQIDLATEPRWSRIAGTFGEDADLTARLVVGYIRGFQGAELGPESVATMVKHFPGGGPQLDGEDPHFEWGKEQVYPGGQQEYHLRPFIAAIGAGATQMMPYYGQPIGTDWEEVGFGFNKDVLTDLLRDRLGFDGIVCTDWGLLTDDEIFGEHLPARAWGVEELTPLQRAKKALDAGVDQFGGEAVPELVVELVRSGQLPESRLDVSVARLLTEKFRLGLFDERRYVDADRAEQIVGCADFRAAGERAQRRSLTLLADHDHRLPLTGRPRLYVQGVDRDIAAGYAELVDRPQDAELALLRVGTPYEPRPGGFQQFFHAGRLDFAADQLEEILALLDQVPTVVAIHLERPAVIPEIAERAAVLLADYGAGDAALLDVLLGRGGARPEGRLPFQLPRTMTEVTAGRPDVPQESKDPVFPFGHGLTYEK